MKIEEDKQLLLSTVKFSSSSASSLGTVGDNERVVQTHDRDDSIGPENVKIDQLQRISVNLRSPICGSKPPFTLELTVNPRKMLKSIISD